MKILKVTYPEKRYRKINQIINEEIEKYRKLKTIKKIINEEIEGIFETKKTEELAINALNKRQIPNADNLINQFKEIDKTGSQILLPAIAKAYIEHPHINDLRGVFEFIGEKINRNKYKSFMATKKGYSFHNAEEKDNKDQQFKDWLGLSGYIHGKQGEERSEADKLGDVNVEGADPIWENDKIAIYDGTKQGDCINYGAGAISGQKYQFCIGIQGSGMHQSYRDSKASTFWYVFDKTKKLSDPLHMVVVDAVDPEFAQTQGYNAPYELTDENNRPATNIAEFGDDVAGYLNYLKQQGVPVDKVLPHNPHTEEEKIAIKLLSKQNPDLNWFLNLGPLAQKEGFATDQNVETLTYKLQSQYIGRGHELSDEQFMHLWPNRTDKPTFYLLKQYVTTGKPLPESQFNVLTGQSNGQSK